MSGTKQNNKSKSWWQMDLEEKSDGELEAASFGYHNNNFNNKRRANNVNRRHVNMASQKQHNLAPTSTLSTTTPPESAPSCDEASISKSEYSSYFTGYTGLTDYSGYEPTSTSMAATKSRKSRQKKTGTEKILNMLEDRVCTSLEYIENDALRDIEDHLKFHKLEEQLEKLKQTDLWQFWQDIAETGSVQSEEPPVSPNIANDKSNSFDDLFGELENSAEAKQRETIGSTKLQYSKQKGLLREATVKDEKAATMNSSRLQNQSRPLGPSNNKTATKPEEKRSGSKPTRVDGKIDFIKTDKVRNVTWKPSSSGSAKSRDSDSAHRNLPLPEVQLTAPPPQPTDEGTELAHIFDGMSDMTGDDHGTFSYLEEHEPRSCIRIPHIGIKTRLDLLKRMKGAIGASSSFRSADSLPVMRMVSESKSTNAEEDAVPIFYVYDYESPNHAYVAYFRRGDTATDGLHLYQHPKPADFATAESEVLVQITASTVSPTDVFIRKGTWWGETSPNKLTLPVVPGVAFAGKVDQIDESSTSKSGIKKGDRVVSLVRVGANSRHLCIDHERLVKVPSDIKDSDCLACLPEIYLAAFQALHFGKKNTSRYRRNCLAHKKILILGGASVLGRALIEIARASGAETVYATARDKEFDLITSIGGLPLSRDPRHWLSAVIGQIDIVVSMEAPYAKPELKYEHIRTLLSDGRLVVVGAPDQGDRTTVEIDTIDGESMRTKRMLHNYNVFDSWESDMKQAKRDLSHVLRFYKEGAIKPQILDRIPLNKIAKAHEFFESKKVTGFVLCEPWITGTKKGLAAPSPIVVHKKLACENRQATNVPSHAPASLGHFRNDSSGPSNEMPVAIYDARNNVRPAPPIAAEEEGAPPRSNISSSAVRQHCHHRHHKQHLKEHQPHHHMQQGRQHHEHHLEQHQRYHSNHEAMLQKQPNPEKKDPYEIRILGAKRDRVLV